MNRPFPTLTLLALTLAISTHAFAQEAKPAPVPSATPAPAEVMKKKKAATPAPTNAPTATPAGPRTMGMYVKVDAIDLPAKTFTHTNKDGAVVKFVVTEKTEIKNGELAAKFEDLKVGDTVSGSRIKKSATEYEIAKITRFGAVAARKTNGETSNKDGKKK